MPVPDRYCSSFSRSTLQTIETHAGRFRVQDPLFFRNAYTADVVESERRTFRPIIMADPERVTLWRCGCQASMQPHDLCRHIALLVASMAGGEDSLPAERFESSVWRGVAFASFSEGLEIRETPGDPREQLLRKYTLSEQEHELLRRGSGSTRLRFESSAWYRWSKDMFVRGAGAEDLRLELAGGARLSVRGEAVPLAPAAVELVIDGAPEIVRASGFEIALHGFAPSLRIEITRSRALRFSPVLLDGGGAVLDRTVLARFGRFFLSGDRFVSVAPAVPMFVEQSRRQQASLFETRTAAGIASDRETIIDEESVFAFVERHRHELAALPESLAPTEVRNAQPVRLEGEVIFDFAAPHKDLLEVAVSFDADGTAVPAAEIARARRDGVRALIRGCAWIDVTDPQFAWLDDATIGPSGRVLVTKLELFRMRGSVRGTAVFRGDPACERVFRMFDELQSESDAPLLPPLGIDLYAYQQTGYQWLWLLQQNGFGGLLCDDMGLGKTHQAIALIRALTHLDPSRSVLVVCPTSLMDHWREKLARYVPDVAVTLTTYGLVRSRFEQFRGRTFDLLVLDEMQTVKNADTATHQALRGIEKRIAVGLTGTPIENHEGELKTLLDFVVPGYLPRHIEDRALLQRLVRPFVLRRTKAQVLTELPPKIVDKRYCELTSEQRALYRRVLESRARPLRTQLRAGATVSYVHIFAALNYLKQICNHPASAGGGFGADVRSGKWETFVELVDECIGSGLKVVVFSQYLQMLDIIEDHLFRSDIQYASIKGATRDRGAELVRFRDDPDCRVFTASLRAGGLGIDLTSASVVIHYDRWWNQAREDQATDRVHRLGQNKGVQVIKLITRNTIEEKIDELIARKGTLAADLIRPDDPSLVKQFTREELDDLLTEE